MLRYRKLASAFEHRHRRYTEVSEVTTEVK